MWVCVCVCRIFFRFAVVRKYFVPWLLFLVEPFTFFREYFSLFCTRFYEKNVQNIYFHVSNLHTMSNLCILSLRPHLWWNGTGHFEEKKKKNASNRRIISFSRFSKIVCVCVCICLFIYASTLLNSTIGTKRTIFGNSSIATTKSIENADDHDDDNERSNKWHKKKYEKLIRFFFRYLVALVKR